MTTKVQLVSDIVGNVSGGASFTGIVTAASFVKSDGSEIGGGAGVSSTGIATAAIFSNPSFITTSYTLTDGTNNYGVFGPISISIGATITVGAGNTFVIV
jgi:hypothetical protein